MQQTNNQTFIHSIDFLRAIAAIAVCIFHFANGFLHAGNPIYDVFKEGHLGVEVFFVITGFLVPYSLFRKNYHFKQFGNYMLDRILRLHPAYLAAVAICILQEFIGSLLPTGRAFWVEWQDVFWHLFYLPPYMDRPWLLILFWTLAIQFQFYILFGLLYGLFFHENKIIRVTMLLIFMAINFSFNDNLTYNNYLPFYMLIFIPGILIFQRMQGMLNNWEYWALLLLDCYLLYDQRFESFLRPSAVLFASVLIQFLSIEHPVWKWLGNISYALYLIHLPVGWSFMNMAKTYTQDEALLSGALIVAVLLSIGAAYLFYRFIETPSQIWAKQILDKQKSKNL